MKHDKTSIMITLSILAILVMASPTQADINIEDLPGNGYNVPLGKFLEFDINMNNVEDIDSFVVLIQRDGADDAVCEFDRNGNNLKKEHDDNSNDMRDACKGIKIMTPGNEYGYGYGYGYGENYRYRVRIETGKGYIHQAGNYNITLNIDDNDDNGTSFNLEVTEPANNGKAKNNGNDNSNNDNSNNANSNNDNSNNGNSNNANNGNSNNANNNNGNSNNDNSNNGKAKGKK